MGEKTRSFKNSICREYQDHKKKGKSKDVELKGHTDSADQLCWDPKHPDLVATAAADKTVCLWDARSEWKMLLTLLNFSGETIGIIYKPDGIHIAVGNKVLEGLLSQYESSSHGPGKWKMLSAFLRQCLEGPILDLFKKQLDQTESERSALTFKCRSNEDKLGLLKKQLEASEKHRAEYLKRYEEAISDKQKFSEEYNSRIANLLSKCGTLEEHCVSIEKDLDVARQESADWKIKYDQSSLELKVEEDKFKAKFSALESRLSAAEGRLVAAREQAESVQEEASEWKRKYAVAVGEAKTALERAALVQERTNKKAQEREDALRAEFCVQLVEKEKEIKNLNAKLDSTENHASIFVAQLEAAQTKLENHELETLALKDEIKKLNSNLDSAKAEVLSYEREAKILKQEKNHLQEKYVAGCKKFNDAEERLKVAERDAKRATELADTARAEVVAAQKEKSEMQQLAMERLAIIERVERQVDSMEREKVKLIDEVKRLHQSEMDAMSKVTLLERRVGEREKEIEDLLSRSNEQRSNTVQVLESLLTTERAARAEANSRAEALSLQLQATQGRLDALHQELTSLRLNETALDGKLRTASHGKRLRVDNYPGTGSVRDTEVDEGLVKVRKRSKRTTSPLKITWTEEGGSVYKGEENYTQSQEHQKTESDDYTKFTILKLKQELTKHGFGGQLLQLRNPNKKEIVAFYEKHVLSRVAIHNVTV